MRKRCRVTINDQVFSAFRGDVLIDVALSNGIDIPFDCRSGHCGICRVRVLDGLAIGGECREPGTVRACQTRIMSDLQLKVEALPEVRTVTGQVRAVARHALDVVEVKIEPSRPIVYLPGQYLKVKFRGYPVRCYNPTVSMEDITERELLHFQVRRFRGGQVSAAIGEAIREGHHVEVLGPFGSAFLRPASQSRLVLVASDTGFAPVWSMAVAALEEHPRRRVVAVVGARALESFYMINALCALARYPNVTIVPVVETPQNVTAAIRVGSVPDQIPKLSAEDSVHVCGPQQLVEAVRGIAAAADALCYCVPFVPQDTGRPANENVLSRARDWFNSAKQHPVASEGGRRAASPRRSQVRETVATSSRSPRFRSSG
ncbi:MAG TPA: 2Fe-2S iron-sulfur cluster binding domain-containing protein [Xanthobacteraceae bacterium]|jgi:3-phenylpropionate/trans-cinnamate dioxygenase ferredoxin reductase subunit